MTESSAIRLLEKLLDPNTLIALATLVTAFAAWRNSKQAKQDVAKNTQLTTEIHGLVNGMSLAGLGREKGDKDRIADLTGAPGDVAAAAQAHENYEVKKADDARVFEGRKGQS